MECTHQFIRFTRGDVNPKTGELIWKNKLFNSDTLKYLIKLKDYYGFKGTKYKLVPCGNCIACKFNESKTWAIRMLNELETSENAYFITLTYDDNHYPSSNSLNKDHLRSFIHSLRVAIYRYLDRNFIKSYPQFKFYAVGEYGSESGRAHYHLIVYNVPFNDFTEFFPDDKGSLIRKCSKSGENLIYSPSIASLWDKGFITIGAVNHASCCYVAGYVQKKLGQYNKEYDDKLIIPPFALMSRGLGFEYFLNNYEKIVETDEIFYRKGDVIFSVPVPQAYLVKLKKLDLIKYKNLMSMRDLKSDTKIKSLMSLSIVDQLNYFKSKRETNIKKISTFTRSI